MTAGEVKSRRHQIQVILQVIQVNQVILQVIQVMIQVKVNLANKMLFL